MKYVTIVVVIMLLLIIPVEALATLLHLGKAEFVKDDGLDIQVPGYSVPSYVDWNNDGLKDIIIGQGSGTQPAKIRVYLNVGTNSNPQFSGFFYVKSYGADLTFPAEGCLGCFPRVDYWNADNRKDLIVGLADGTVKVFINTGTDENPAFEGGYAIQVDSPNKDLDVGKRATPTTVDWDSDGRKDLVVGALDGAIHIYINCGCGGSIPPHFNLSQPLGDFAQENGSALFVPTQRSSPVILDLDGDGKKDLLTGNTEGQLLLYRNVGTDIEPLFSGYSLVYSNGIPIDLSGSPRSRPFVCDWTNDGYFDVLIGAADGKVLLFQSIPQLADIDKDYDVDLNDFAILAASWYKFDCGLCDGADLTGDGFVDALDLQLIADNWLAGVE